MVIILNLFLPGRIGDNPAVIQTAVTVITFVGAIISSVIPRYLLLFVVVASLAILIIPPAMASRPKFSSGGITRYH